MNKVSDTTLVRDRNCEGHESIGAAEAETMGQKKKKTTAETKLVEMLVHTVREKCGASNKLSENYISKCIKKM